MKLEDYAVREALLDRRWLEAAQLVARYFERQIDFSGYGFRIGDIDPTGPEIIIYLREGGFISWVDDRGFAAHAGGSYLWRGNVLIGNERRKSCNRSIVTTASIAFSLDTTCSTEKK